VPVVCTVIFYWWVFAALRAANTKCLIKVWLCNRVAPVLILQRHLTFFGNRLDLPYGRLTVRECTRLLSLDGAGHTTVLNGVVCKEIIGAVFALSIYRHVYPLLAILYIH
jgi:hypothetical protein